MEMQDQDDYDSAVPIIKGREGYASSVATGEESGYAIWRNSQSTSPQSRHLQCATFVLLALTMSVAVIALVLTVSHQLTELKSVQEELQQLREDLNLTSRLSDTSQQLNTTDANPNNISISHWSDELNETRGKLNALESKIQSLHLTDGKTWKETGLQNRHCSIKTMQKSLCKLFLF